MGLTKMKSLLIIAIVAGVVGVAAPLPTVQGLCAPIAESFGVTEFAGHYLKNSFVLIGTSTQSERFEIWEENNGVPGLQTTSGEACGAKPDALVAGFTEGATAYATFSACTTGTVSWCPVTAG